MKAAFLKGLKIGASGLKEAVNSDLSRVDARIGESLATDVPFIADLSEIVLAPSGKRLRPALLILAADTAGRSDGAVILAASVVEMIHTATLLHDDVVDRSQQRRGRPTLNAFRGDGAAILMGDFIYSRAITLLVEAKLTQVLALLATTVHRMSVGELLQLELKERGLLDEESYRRVIYEKTARLIEATCESGAILGARARAEREALRDFGREVGMAFQIVDDVLDYVADAATLGKPVGSDLAEGKQTLPLLKAHQRAGAAARGRLLELLREPAERVEELIALVREEGGVEAALADARGHGERARTALGGLPAGEIRDALDSTVDFVLERRL